MTKDSKVYKYEYITLENGKYYGINSAKDNNIKTELSSNEITSVRLQDKKKSKFLNTMIPVSIIGVVFGGIIISEASKINLYPGFGN